MRLSDEELSIIEDALGFYRSANIDVAHPTSDDQWPKSDDVRAVEARIAKARAAS